MKHSDIAIDQNGDILVLVTTDEEPFFILTRCNYRGELPVTVEVAELPKVSDAGSSFKPLALRCRDGLVFLQDKEMNCVVIDASGHCVGIIRSFDEWSNVQAANGPSVPAVTTATVGRSLFSTVFTALDRLAQRITKSSSLCNGTDSAKTLYSRNGLWIGRYEN